MAKSSKHMKAKALALQNSQPSEDESSPQRHRDTSHIRTAENMLSASRKRREAKRKAIESEHKQRVERVRARIESFYEDRKAKMTLIQGAQWEQLGALLKTRKSIEKAILKNGALIEQATLNMSRELATMYAARQDEMLEIDATDRVRERTESKE